MEKIAFSRARAYARQENHRRSLRDRESIGGSTPLDSMSHALATRSSRVRGIAIAMCHEKTSKLSRAISACADQPTFRIAVIRRYGDDTRTSAKHRRTENVLNRRSPLLLLSIPPTLFHRECRSSLHDHKPTGGVHSSVESNFLAGRRSFSLARGEVTVKYFFSRRNRGRRRCRPKGSYDY